MLESLKIKKHPERYVTKHKFCIMGSSISKNVFSVFNNDDLISKYYSEFSFASIYEPIYDKELEYYDETIDKTNVISSYYKDYVIDQRHIVVDFYDHTLDDIQTGNTVVTNCETIKRKVKVTDYQVIDNKTPERIKQNLEAFDRFVSNYKYHKIFIILSEYADVDCETYVYQLTDYQRNANRMLCSINNSIKEKYKDNRRIKIIEVPKEKRIVKRPTIDERDYIDEFYKYIYCEIIKNTPTHKLVLKD